MSLRVVRIVLAATLAFAALVPAASAAAPAYVYATSWGMTVRQYAADGSGLLAPLAPPAAVAGSDSTGAATTPDGRHLYVVNQASDSVSQYDIAADGMLVPKAPATVATGASPFGIAVAPDGGHVYVANQDADSVSIFAVGADGALVPQGTVTVGDGPVAIALSPDGGSAYVTNLSADTVSQLTVAADGGLTPKTPAAVAAGASPVGVAVSPDGASAYVVNQVASGTVRQFNVGAEGELNPKTPASVPVGAQPAAILAGPDGVYVTDFGSGTVSQFDVGPTGALAPMTPASVPGPRNPFGLALGPDGSTLYVAGFGDASVAQYDVAADGTLAVKAPAAVAAGFRPVAIAVAPAAAVPPEEDAIAPTVTLTTPPDGARYRLGEVVLAEYACADEGGSGLVECAGDVASGARVDTSTLGAQDFTVVARDGAGNETVVTHRYAVVLGTLTFHGPIRSGSVVRAGAVLPIRFSVGGDAGLDILAERSPRSIRVDCRSPRKTRGRSEPALLGKPLRYDPVGDRYRLEWRTRRSWAGTCRSFTVELRDGRRYRLLIRFRPAKTAEPRVSKR